ncbi:5-oxoprolinase subunit C family protein [Mangrovibrevibacter kandeliae]|uniref:5-oxoprolinase subunit C family protein n=1 Tax=Mangrovibrevibacter kandeliae TaxID=2968473 RepID=UPI0021180404|nr:MULTISPECIES: biotin-dependent carboxyltransferase family protein [unclassified Aurantimonas]MCQ8781608.1 biotin-dependent carboxyltransferase family protein [Aurantimonas sp. CSK15Z-1]MCW4114946.1 biotin-dependent carboxyltransferase family protein [Aurantimonas sp. MSK8Z-1]
MTGQLRVLTAGPMTTVQDLGRFGFLRFGVSASGPMDSAALAVANALVGNAPGDACLEFALTGGSFAVTRPALVAVTGGTVEICRDGRRLPAWEAHPVEPGSRITVSGLAGAVWGYLAVSGGLATPPVMGSRATHLRSAVGGLEGRSLRAGDALPLGDDPHAVPKRLVLPFRPQRGPILVVPGPQEDHFAPAVWRTFLGGDFAVTAMRDRMAMTLDGPSLPATRGHDIVSDGTVMGSIQVAPTGRPIVLMADRQTTGGFAKIATIVSHEIARLAQTPAGRLVRFRAVDAETAVQREREARARLDEAIATLRPA